MFCQLFNYQFFQFFQFLQFLLYSHDFFMKNSLTHTDFVKLIDMIKESYNVPNLEKIEILPDKIFTPAEKLKIKSLFGGCKFHQVLILQQERKNELINNGMDKKEALIQAK